MRDKLGVEDHMDSDGIGVCPGFSGIPSSPHPSKRARQTFAQYATLEALFILITPSQERALRPITLARAHDCNQLL